ncbi:hypothetical protein OAP63_06000 [Vibrio sp.]|nr:hypothetical protein [Vibrio sp.]
MNVSQLQQVIGTNVPFTNRSSNNTGTGSGVPNRPESLHRDHPIHEDSVDTNDPVLQRSTVSYLNKLLEFHGLAMQAELSNTNGQTYISLSDMSTGDLIKRLKIEDVIHSLMYGDHSMVNLTV